MRKIDSHQFTRLMNAMEQLAKEMDSLHQPKVADEIAVKGSELEEIYRKNEQLVKQLEENVEEYFDAFDRAHSVYREASRKQSKIKVKVRATARRLEKKQTARKQRA